MKFTCLFRFLPLAGLVVLPGCGPKSAGGEPARDFPVQVLVTEARREAVVESLSLVGSLAANERVELKAETDGVIEEILFQEGQKAKQGDLLFRLDETKFKAALAEAEARYRLSESNLERVRQLLEKGSASPQEFDQARATFEVSRASLELMKRQLRDARIVAPFDGVMGPRLVSPGQVISRNVPLGSLVSIDPIKVEFDVPERFLGQTRLGQKIDLHVVAHPGERFQGEVFFIAPQLNADTRTALVKARLPNPEGKLRPGMFASLDLRLKVRDQAVVIPEAALLLRENKASVFVVGENDTAEMRDVKVGVRMAGRLEITEGLQGGEKVIVEGTQKVRPGGKVKAIPAGAS